MFFKTILKVTFYCSTTYIPATVLSKFGSNPNSRPGLQLNIKPDEQSNTSLTFPGLHGSQELRGL